MSWQRVFVLWDELKGATKQIDSMNQKAEVIEASEPKK